VRFRGGGSEAVTFQDDIILDQTRPTVTRATASSIRRTGRIAVVRFSTQATDRVSGVAQQQVTATKTRPGLWSAYRRSSAARVPARSQVLYVRVRDRAGNLSAWRLISLA
jgi:hypothetical protein